MSHASKWTRFCRLSVAFNILSLVLFAVSLGFIASEKVMSHTDQMHSNDVWIDVPVFWPSFLIAALTFLLLKVLTDELKKVFTAINTGLGLYTLYYLTLVI